MLTSSRTKVDVVDRLRREDPHFTTIYLNKSHNYRDLSMTEVIDTLIEHPDVVEDVFMGENGLTDVSGVKLARYVARSSTVGALILSFNHFTTETFVALAWALRVNTSLRYLSIEQTSPIDRDRAESAFIDALRVNPKHSIRSTWTLFSHLNDFEHLQKKAEELGHPSLQMLLLHRV